MDEKIASNVDYWGLYEFLKRSRTYWMYCNYMKKHDGCDISKLPPKLLKRLYGSSNTIDKDSIILFEEPPLVQWHRFFGDVFNRSFDEVWCCIKDNPPKLDLFHDQPKRKPRSIGRKAFEEMFRIVDASMEVGGKPREIAIKVGVELAKTQKWRNKAGVDLHSTIGRDHRGQLVRFTNILENLEHFGVFPGKYQESRKTTLLEDSIKKGHLTPDQIRGYLAEPLPPKPQSDEDLPGWNREVMRRENLLKFVKEQVAKGRVPPEALP